MKSTLLQFNAAYQKEVENLLEELADSNDAILNMAALDGGWSAIQTVHHLILTEELSLQYVQKKLSFNPKLETADFKTRLRASALWFYLNLPFKFKAPANVSEEKLPGFTTFAQTRSRWLDIRQKWTNFLEQLPVELLDKAVYRHPFAGRLSWMGMLKFFRFHFQRHRKQIRRTLGR